MKYYKAEDVLAIFHEGERPLNWTDSESEIQEVNDFYYYKGLIESTPTIEVMEYPQVEGITPTLVTPEVSEDCISREWVLQMLTTYEKDRSSANELDEWQNRVVEWIEMDIKDAPSIVPSRAEGEWYRQTTDQFDYWECSECGMGVSLDDIKNYCPNCGAKMKG